MFPKHVDAERTIKHHLNRKIPNFKKNLKLLGFNFQGQRSSKELISYLGS